MIEITRSGSFNFIYQYNMDDVNALMKIYIATKILSSHFHTNTHIHTIDMVASNGKIKSKREK